MIQRIQSGYLLLAALLLLLLFFVPTASFVMYEGGVAHEIGILPFGVTDGNGLESTLIPTIYYGILTALTMLLLLVVIFLFKRRLLQMRLVISGMVLQLGIAGYVAYYVYKAYSVVDALRAAASDAVTPVSMSPVCVVPLVTLILSYLAFRGIVRDEMLIRSLDRIR
ncbi:MAG: DUF4293 domain-containing protein [Rikenellaceae bacterium]|nr:DUF4293 domain-containing protein [Rikenellaceae bacterium]